MNTQILLLLIVTMTFFSCEEERIETPMQVFLIKEGKHYSNQKPGFLQTDKLSFEAIFDESAKYTLQSETEQHDI